MAGFPGAGLTPLVVEAGGEAPARFQEVAPGDCGLVIRSFVRHGYFPPRLRRALV